MPFQRNHQLKRFRRRFVRRAKPVKAKTLRRVVRQVRNMTRSIETKFSDYYQLTPNSYNQGGTGYNLTAQISQGLADFQDRVGDLIMVKNIIFRVRCIGNAAATSITQQLRFIIVRVKNDNQVAWPLGNVIQYPSTSIATYSPSDWDDRGLQKVLFDKVVTIPSGANNVTNALPERNFNAFIKVNDISQYVTTSNNTSKGGIFLFILSDSTTNNPQTLSWFTRITYTDQ